MVTLTQSIEPVAPAVVDFSHDFLKWALGNGAPRPAPRVGGPGAPYELTAPAAMVLDSDTGESKELKCRISCKADQAPLDFLVTVPAPVGSWRAAGFTIRHDRDSKTAAIIHGNSGVPVAMKRC